MTQEVIDKFHELEAKRELWVAFKDALVKAKNVCIQDYSHTACTDMAWLNMHNLENWDEFQTYILKYVDIMINMYNEEIAEL